MKRYVILALLTAVLLAGCTPAPEATENQESSLPVSENSAQISENPENEQQTGDEVWQRKDGKRIFQYRKTPDGYLFTLETVYHDDECEKVMAIFSYLTKDGKNLFRQHEAYDEEGGLIERNYYSFDDEGNTTQRIRTQYDGLNSRVAVFNGDNEEVERYISRDGQIIMTAAVSDEGMRTESYYIDGDLCFCMVIDPEAGFNDDFYGYDALTIMYNEDMEPLHYSSYNKNSYVLDDGKILTILYADPGESDFYREIYIDRKFVASYTEDSEGDFIEFKTIAEGYSEKSVKDLQKKVTLKCDEINQIIEKWYDFLNSGADSDEN